MCIFYITSEVKIVVLFSVQHVDDPFLKPVKLLDEKLAQNDVYASPIVIVPGSLNLIEIYVVQFLCLPKGTR